MRLFNPTKVAFTQVFQYGGDVKTITIQPGKKSPYLSFNEQRHFLKVYPQLSVAEDEKGDDAETVNETVKAIKTESKQREAEVMDVPEIDLELEEFSIDTEVVVQKGKKN